MNLKKLLRAKKYRTRIFIWITSVMIILIIMFSALIYLNVEKTVLSSEYETSQKILNQMKYNIDFLDQMVKNLCLSTYYSNDIKTLMNFTEEETYEQMNIINKLSNSVVASNPYIQSIYVYNNGKKVFYSTYNTFKYQDPDLLKLIESNPNIPILKPIFRRTESYHSGDVIKYSNVLSYFMYEMKDKQNNMQGAVIINIKLDWLIENINIINMFNNSRQDRIFIINDEGEFIRDGVNSNPGSTQFEDYLRKLYFSKKINVERIKQTELLKDSINGKNYFISIIPIEQAGWVMYKVQPYSIVFDYINKLKITILVITGIVLILIFIASYSISKGIYRPFEGLLKLVGFNSQNDVKARQNVDEFSYLHEVYKNSIDQIEKFSTERRNNEKIIKTYFLRKLILQSGSISDEEFEINKAEHDLLLDRNQPFRVILLIMDRHKEFEEKNDLKTRELTKFAVVNITTEILAAGFYCEAVEMKNDEIAIILNSASKTQSDMDLNSDRREISAADAYDKLIQKVREAQEIVFRYYNISFTAVFSEEMPEAGSITRLYNQAADCSVYRFVFGLSSVILPEMLNKNSFKTDFKYENQNKLLGELKQANLKNAESCLESIIEDIRKLEYNNMMLSIAHLVNSLKNTVYDMNQTNREPIIVSPILSSNEIFELETIDEFKEIILMILRQIAVKVETKTGNRDIELAESIQHIIMKNYTDYDLSIAGISEKLRLPAARISKVFKENYNMSVVEYINMVRLEKAVEWMENSRLSIGEIMNKVGIENESYFYKIFKAKYGTTPRGYISNNYKKQ